MHVTVCIWKRNEPPPQQCITCDFSVVHQWTNVLIPHVFTDGFILQGSVY